MNLVEKNVVTTDKKILANTFNKRYINIVEINSGKNPPKKFKNATW